MEFDKNQEKFKNEISKKIWIAATLTVPIDKSTVYIKDNTLKESCIEFYNFKYALYSDMYENPETYGLPSSFEINDYNSILICVLRTGIIDGDTLIVDMRKFNEINRNRHWRARTDEMFKSLERQGIIYTKHDSIIMLSSKLYPKMFYSAKELARAIERYKNNGGQQEKYFQYCEFRAMENKFKRNLDTLIETLSDERLIPAKAIQKFAAENNIKPVTRIYYNDLLCNYKSRKIMLLTTHENMLNATIYCGEKGYESLCGEVDNRDNSGELKKYLFKNLSRCTSCNGAKKNRCGHYYDVGGEKVMLCPLSVTVKNCKNSDIPYIIQFLDIAMDSINSIIF